MVKDKNDDIKTLSKVIFWDVNINRLDYRKSKQTIIERIAVYGTENDERVMNTLYSPKLIKKCLLKSDSLNEKTIRYYAFLLNQKEENFKCYSRIHVQMTC